MQTQVDTELSGGASYIFKLYGHKYTVKLNYDVRNNHNLKVSGLSTWNMNRRKM